jgi:starvation-inducible DNA-binding protein
MIAERVLTLGGTPLHTFEDYIKHNKIVVGKNISNDEKQFN